MRPNRRPRPSSRRAVRGKRPRPHPIPDDPRRGPNTTILDGGAQADQRHPRRRGRRVVLENLTARYYSSTVLLDRRAGLPRSYLTAYANGDYGIYAFRSQWGRFEHSYASGSPDSGFYIGECQPCHAVVDDVLAEGNALGYSGTNAGGDLWIINSEWAHNGAGIVPNTLDSEGLAPQRGATIAGNSVHDQGLDVVPTKRLQTPAFGTGILIGGGRDNIVEGTWSSTAPCTALRCCRTSTKPVAHARHRHSRQPIGGSGRQTLRSSGPRSVATASPATSVNSVPPAIETFAGCDLPAGAGGDLAPTVSLLVHFLAALGGHYDPGDWQNSVAPDEQPSMPDAATAPVVLAVPEVAVPGPHVVRSLEATLAATSSSVSVAKRCLPWAFRWNRSPRCCSGGTPRPAAHAGVAWISIAMLTLPADLRTADGSDGWPRARRPARRSHCLLRVGIGDSRKSGCFLVLAEWLLSQGRGARGGGSGPLESGPCRDPGSSCDLGLNRLDPGSLPSRHHHRRRHLGIRRNTGRGGPGGGTLRSRLATARSTKPSSSTGCGPCTTATTATSPEPCRPRRVSRVQFADRHRPSLGRSGARVTYPHGAHHA